MQSTHPTGTHRVCYQCNRPAHSGSMFCLECLPERFPPIIHEKPPKPPRRSLWQMFAGMLRLRSHARSLSARIDTLEADLRDTQQANKALRLRSQALKAQLEELTRAFDDCDAERAKLARKVISAGIDWAPVTEIALNHLGDRAEMPAIASWVADRLRQYSANKNADTVVPEQSSALPAPLGQNPETEIAPGHNPDRVTVDQVGEGWRLLNEEEISGAKEGILNREIWIQESNRWSSGYNGSISAFTYRVRI